MSLLRRSGDISYAGRGNGALLDCSPAAILRTTIVEGCIGETRAALEAAEAARLSEDPGVRAVLLGIAADESRHAELAWTAVRFMLTEHPELLPVARAEFSRVETRDTSSTQAGAGADSPATVFDAALRHGLLNEETLARVQTSAWFEVILPCAAALLETMAARPLAA